MAITSVALSSASGAACIDPTVAADHFVPAACSTPTSAWSVGWDSPPGPPRPACPGIPAAEPAAAPPAAPLPAAPLPAAPLPAAPPPAAPPVVPLVAALPAASPA